MMEVYLMFNDNHTEKRIIKIKDDPLKILKEEVRKYEKGKVFRGEVTEVITPMISLPVARYLSPIAAEIEKRVGEGEFWNSLSPVSNLIATLKYNLENGKVPLTEQEKFYKIKY